jgi:hypothetical protein
MGSRMKTSERETMKTSATIFAACGLFSALALGGCNALMQQPKCPELASCGGDVPIGTWVLMPGHGSCTEDIYVAPTDPRLPGGVVPAARTAPPEPALFDWCDQLVTKAFDPQMGILVQPAYIFTPDIQIGVASVSYNQDGTYSAGLGRTGQFQITFPSLCMREFGATDNNPAVDPKMAAPVGGPVNICKQLELPLGQSWKGGGSIPDFSCDVDKDPNDPGGCTCFYSVNQVGGGGGTYLTLATSPMSGLDSNEILNLPGKDFPQSVTYCNTGNELQLTGRNGQYLFGTLGLRTLDLVKMP